MDPITDSFSNEAVDVHALPKFEKVEFQRISDKYLKKVFFQTGISLLLFLLGWGVLLYNQYLDTGLSFLLLGGIVLVFSFKFWNTYKMQGEYGFAIREKDILYKRGFIFSRTTVIPFNRIQHVSISRDAFDKMLNISSLGIFTAGGSGSDIHIPGLSPDLALRMKGSLSKKLSDES